MAALAGAAVAAAPTFLGAVRRVWVRLKAVLCCSTAKEPAETEATDDVDGDNNVKVDNIISCCGGRTVNVRNEHPYDREWFEEIKNHHNRQQQQQQQKQQQQQQQPVSDSGEYEKNIYVQTVVSDNRTYLHFFLLSL